MFERHFGLRENPFHSGHQMRFLYPSREHQEARAHLRYGIENREPFVLITGEVGTGKTTALYDALDEWGSQVAVALITNSALTRQELLEEICLRFGLPVPPGTSKPQALAQLERHLTGVRTRGEHAVLILDEAQNLATELLEEIRLLSNLETRGEKLVQIFLVGQPELEAKLARPELRQLRQRITVHYRLNPLSPEETAGYIHHRISVAGGNAWVVFPPEACREVFRVTHGIPREINTVASQALITAFSENSPGVRAEHVRVVAQESEFMSVLGEPPADAPEIERYSAPAEPVTAAPPPPAVAAPPAPEPAAEPRAAQPPAAWMPPAPVEAPATPSGVEFVEQHEMDAWTAAAGQLLEAKRRLAAAAPNAPPVREEPAAAPAPAPVEAPVAPRSVEERVREATSVPAPREEGSRYPSLAALTAQSSNGPAEPRAAEPLATETRSAAALPGRLQEKLAAELEQEATKRNMLPFLFGAIALAGIAVSIVLLQRFQVIDVPFLRGIAGTSRASGPVANSVISNEPAVVVAHHDSAMAALLPAARRDSLAPPVVAPPKPAVAKPAPRHQPVAKVPVTAKPAAPDNNLYGIGVAAYLDESRASLEAAKVSDDIHLPARVMPYTDNGTLMYRIVVGNWPSRAAASAAASDLVSAGSIHEALILVVGRARQN